MSAVPMEVRRGHPSLELEFQLVEFQLEPPGLGAGN